MDEGIDHLEGVHEVCQLCAKKCKQSFTYWSGCMPPTEYCAEFERKEEVPKE